MKISRLEFVTLLLAAAFLAFTAGWFFRGNVSAPPLLVESERTLAGQSALVLSAPGESGREPININTASARALETLPGIGPGRAADIVAYREEHGPFRIPEEITKVKGIGESTMEGLIDLITTGG